LRPVWGAIPFSVSLLLQRYRTTGAVCFSGFSSAKITGSSYQHLKIKISHNIPVFSANPALIFEAETANF